MSIHPSSPEPPRRRLMQRSTRWPSVYHSPSIPVPIGIYRDREHAGRVLAGLVVETIDPRCCVVGVSSGGLAVAAAVAIRHDLRLLPCQVEAVTSEPAGGTFAAATVDGGIEVDHRRVAALGLRQVQVDDHAERALARLHARASASEYKWLGRLYGRPAVVVGDGASPTIVLRAALAAVRRAGASRLVLALPIGRRRDVWHLARFTDATYCARLHVGAGFVAGHAYVA